MRRAAKRDTSEIGIVEDLEAHGAKVLRLDRFDLLVLYDNTLFMIDAKTIENANTGYFRIKPSQQALIDAGWPLRFACSGEEARQIIGAMKKLEKW